MRSGVSLLRFKYPAKHTRWYKQIFSNYAFEQNITFYIKGKTNDIYCF